MVQFASHVLASSWHMMVLADLHLGLPCAHTPHHTTPHLNQTMTYDVLRQRTTWGLRHGEPTASFTPCLQEHRPTVTRPSGSRSKASGARAAASTTNTASFTKGSVPMCTTATITMKRDLIQARLLPTGARVLSNHLKRIARGQC